MTPADRLQVGRAVTGRIPLAWDAAGLQEAGFVGFARISELRATRLSAVPTTSGVYAVLYPSSQRPEFLVASTGGWFKGRDPSVSLASLHAAWVPASGIVYLGKAGSDDGAGQGLRKRLDQLLKFGSGRAVGHWGGRYLWHLPSSEDLVVAWRGSMTPRMEERGLLEAFRAAFGALPFANRVG